MNKLLLTLSILGLAISSAFAQASFETIDADQSGYVTLDEANAAGMPWTEEQFNAADLDKDGALNSDEFATALQ